MRGKDHITNVFMCSHNTMLIAKFYCTVFFDNIILLQNQTFFDSKIFLDHENFLVVQFFCTDYLRQFLNVRLVR
jgi:hypothetical protein